MWETKKDPLDVGLLCCELLDDSCFCPPSGQASSQFQRRRLSSSSSTAQRLGEACELYLALCLCAPQSNCLTDSKLTARRECAVKRQTHPADVASWYAAPLIFCSWEGKPWLTLLRKAECDVEQDCAMKCDAIQHRSVETQGAQFVDALYHSGARGAEFLSVS